MKKILRITTVSHSLDLLLKGQLNYIGSKGFEVHIACTNDNSIQSIIERENVIYHPLQLTRTISPLKDLVALWKAIKIINECKPDIVHTHSPKAGIVGMLASRITGVPLKIHTVAGLPLMETEGIKKWVLIRIEKLTYSCANFILPNSLNLKKYIHENISISSKVEVIGRGSSNGIDLEYFNSCVLNKVEIESLRNQHQITESTLVFCFVGRLTNYKGIKELVRAFKELNKLNEKIKLLLVGPYEELNPLDDKTLDEIHSNFNIITVGHQTDIRPFLQMSDVFVFPSYREGFPQSLMQAAAMNLACIASDINGCNEIIEHKFNGLLVKSKDWISLYKAMELLLQDKELRKKLAHNARLNMESNFEQKKFWDLIIAFYNLKLDTCK